MVAEPQQQSRPNPWLPLFSSTCEIVGVVLAGVALWQLVGVWAAVLLGAIVLVAVGYGAGR